MEWSLLGGLTVEDRQRIVQAARRRRYARHEVIFHEGDPGDTLHLLAVGHVAVRITTPLGDTATLTVLGPGDAFGELALLVADARRTATVVALEPSQTLTLRRAQFDELRRTQPALDRLLIDLLAADVTRLSERLLEALYVPADKRVLRRLLGLAEQYGGGRAGTVVPFTQEDLATMAGTTRPTVNRILHDAETAGVIKVSRGRVEIVDPAGLTHSAR
jgi:CRP/FNR family transcriptional regulator, cyclic AMP receptor protein